MQTTTVFLHEAQDAENSYALALPGDTEKSWRAEQGFGNDFKRIWNIDFESDAPPSLQAINWDAVLTRAIEAYSMNDPVITNYTWPLLDPQTRGSAA